MSDNIFDQTSTLFSEIVSDAIAPRETRPDYPGYYDFTGPDKDEAYGKAMKAYREWEPSEAASADSRRVNSADEVEVGDVVILTNNDRRGGEWRDRVKSTTTLSDLLLVAGGNGGLAVVVKKTAKRFAVVGLHYGFWTYDHATLERDDDAYAETMAGSTNARTVIATGLTYDALVAKVTADERFPKALRKQAKARAKQAKWDAQQEAQRKAEADERAPFKAKAKQVNDAVSVRVAESKDYGKPGLEVRDLKWLGVGDFYSLATLALEARLLKGEISQQDHDTALATLREISGEEEE